MRHLIQLERELEQSMHKCNTINNSSEAAIAASEESMAWSLREFIEFMHEAYEMEINPDTFEY